MCLRVHMYTQGFMLTNNTLKTAEELQQQMEVSKHVLICILWYTHSVIHILMVALESWNIGSNLLRHLIAGTLTVR